MRHIIALIVTSTVIGAGAAQVPNLAQQLPNTWIKRSPLMNGPLSPSLGYEGSFGYDPKAKLVIRWAGHNQGGGGEQNAETWTFDPVSAKWTLKEPNTSPPGACCNAQNLFDPIGGRFLRFPAFSGSHGWHWFRENYLSNTSVWTYDLPTNTWRDMRPVPALHPRPLRCASWDDDFQVVVIFGGEGSNDGTIVYDPYENSWLRMRPKTEPKPRSAGNLAYHKGLKKHFLFGTQFGDDPHTWVYDIVKNEWTDLTPLAQPPTDKNDAVLAYDEVNDVIVASVRVFGQTNTAEQWHYQTWIYEHKKNTWRKMNPEGDPPGGGQRRRIMVALPDQNVVLMENYVNPPQKVPGVDREQQIWTYRYDTPKRKIVPPASSLRGTTMDDKIVLLWNGDEVSQWEIRRTRGNKPWLTNDVKTFSVRGDDGGSKIFTDKDVKPGEIYSYTLTAIDAAGERSAPRHIRMQPRVVEDVVCSVHSTTKVTLSWPASSTPFIGYHIERAPVEVFTEDQITRLRTDTAVLKPASVGAIKAIGKFERLTAKPIQQTTFTDIGIDLSKRLNVNEKEETYRHRFASSQIYEDGRLYRYGVYAYRIRAVNQFGVESGAGPYVLTVPSAPQHVFSKEDGVRCQLKWAKNPEQGLAGYRVYRMESPRINGAGQKVARVTKDPVRDEKHTDEIGDRDTRRYWIVAVDALGQEGIPSAPTWFERQFKKYYVPFTGEWHQ